MLLRTYLLYGTAYLPYRSFSHGVVKVSPSYTFGGWRTIMSSAVSLMHKMHDHPADMYVFSVDDRASFASRQSIMHCWAPEQRLSRAAGVASKVRQARLEVWRTLCLGDVQNFWPHDS